MLPVIPLTPLTHNVCVSCENWERLALQYPSKDAIVVERLKTTPTCPGFGERRAIFVGNCETGLYAFHNSPERWRDGSADGGFRRSGPWKELQAEDLREMRPGSEQGPESFPLRAVRSGGNFRRRRWIGTRLAACRRPAWDRLKDGPSPVDDTQRVANAPVASRVAPSRANRECRKPGCQILREGE